MVGKAQFSPAVVHDGSQQIVDLGRALLEAVVHVDLMLVVVLEGLHDVLKVRVLSRRPDQGALPHPASPPEAHDRRAMGSVAYLNVREVRNGVRPWPWLREHGIPTTSGPRSFAAGLGRKGSPTSMTTAISRRDSTAMLHSTNRHELSRRSPAALRER